MSPEINRSHGWIPRTPFLLVDSHTYAGDTINVQSEGAATVTVTVSNDLGLGGRGGVACGNGVKDAGDFLDTASLDIINEMFATVFAFEL